MTGRLPRVAFLPVKRSGGEIRKIGVFCQQNEQRGRQKNADPDRSGGEDRAEAWLTGLSDLARECARDRQAEVRLYLLAPMPEMAGKRHALSRRARSLHRFDPGDRWRESRSSRGDELSARLQTSRPYVSLRR